MIKYYNSMVVFEEIPDEITLAINITNCPCHCKGCHSKFLWEDIGNELTYDALKELIHKNDGITCVCFMGGDANPDEINDLAEKLKRHSSLKVAWYSGREKLSDKINLNNFDYIKLGGYDETLGGLNKPTTNQRLYKYDKYFSDYTIGKCWRDITSKFWKNKTGG